MANFFRHRHRSADSRPSNEGTPAGNGKSPPLLSGAGLSVALSVLFYVLVLAADAKFDSGPRIGRKAASVMQVASRPPTDSVPMPAVSAEAPAQSDESAHVLLARAHDCASAERWDCVFDATTSAIALGGETPETEALLEQAMNAGTGKAPRPQATARAVNLHRASLESNASTKGARETRHRHKYAKRDKKVRYAAVARPASFADMATLYHQ